MIRKITLITLLWITLAAHAEIKTEEITYDVGDAKYTGFLAYDNDIKGRRPGILVVHEWWGLNEYIRTRAVMLAKLGYTALALDMFGSGRRAEHPKDAQQLASEVRGDMSLATKRFTTARNILAKHKTVDSKRIGAIGYCFGGGIVLDMARMGQDLSGVVSFHGTLATGITARKGEVKSEILVLNGAADPFTTAEQIEAFKKEMQTANARYTFVNYPNAMHAFTNPAATDTGRKFNLPLAYNEQADKASWEEMQAFFKRVF